MKDAFSNDIMLGCHHCKMDTFGKWGAMVPLAPVPPPLATSAIRYETNAMKARKVRNKRG